MRPRRRCRIYLLKEEWRVVAIDPRYEVSSLGRVRYWGGRGRYAQSRASRPKPCRFQKHRQGYSLVRIGTVQRYVHQLVATAFLGPRPSGHDTRHLNDINTDNRATNLAYGTRSQNVREAYVNGRHRPGDVTRKARNAAKAFWTRLSPEERSARMSVVSRKRWAA